VSPPLDDRLLAGRGFLRRPPHRSGARGEPSRPHAWRDRLRTVMPPKGKPPDFSPTLLAIGLTRDSTVMASKRWRRFLGSSSLRRAAARAARERPDPGSQPPISSAPRLPWCACSAGRRSHVEPA